MPNKRGLLSPSPPQKKKIDPHQDVTVKIQILLSSGRTKQLVYTESGIGLTLQPWKLKHSEEMPSKFWRKSISTLWLYTMPKYQSRGKVKIKKFSDILVLQTTYLLCTLFTGRHWKIMFHQHDGINQERGWWETQQTGHPTETSTRNSEDEDRRSQWCTKHGSSAVYTKQVGKIMGRLLQKGETDSLSALPELSETVSTTGVSLGLNKCYYRLNVCVPPKIRMLRPNPQCDDIRRWDLWEVIWSWGWNPQDWD